MACKRSEQCEHADICQYAKSNAYDILGGSCYRPKKPQTNEEYLRSCTTEQLAECITNISFNTGYDSYNVVYRKMVEWLKQPHKDGEL